MADPFDPKSSPKALNVPKVRRLSKLPLLLLGGVIISVVALMAYSLYARGQMAKANKAAEEPRLTVDSRGAAAIIQDYDKPPPLPTDPPLPDVMPFDELVEKPAIQPPPPKPEPIVIREEVKPAPPVMSEEEKARLERLRQIQAQRDKLALAALTAGTFAADAPASPEQEAGQTELKTVEDKQRQALLDRISQPQQPAADLARIEMLLATIASNTGAAVARPASQTQQQQPVPQPGRQPQQQPGSLARLGNNISPAPAQSSPTRSAGPALQIGSSTSAAAGARPASQPQQQPVQPPKPAQSDGMQRIAQLVKDAPPGTFQETQKKYGYSQEWQRDQLTDYDLRVGTIIPAIMINGISSDLPGEVIAQVSQNVRDSTHGKHILIPQGTRIIGSYNNDVAFGQSRVRVDFHRLQFPNGKTLAIGDMTGSDQTGLTGFKDKVNNHYLKTFGGATLLGLIGGLASSSQSDNNTLSTSTGETVADEIGRQYAQVGQDWVKRNLDVSPTIEIRPGYRFNIFVTQDFALKPYEL